MDIPKSARGRLAMIEERCRLSQDGNGYVTAEDVSHVLTLIADLATEVHEVRLLAERTAR